MTIKKTCAEFGIKNERREERCRKLRKLAKNMKGTNLWSKKKKHKVKPESKTKKIDFSRGISYDECRATLAGPDGWESVLVFHENSQDLDVGKERACCLSV